MTFNTELWNGQAPGAEGYQIERSLRFNSSDSAYLSRTPSVAGNRKTWTWAGWVKLAAFADTSPHIFGTDNDDANRSALYYTATNQLGFYSRTSAVTDVNVTTTAVYRDYSAWYHIVLAVDTNQATPANVTKIYVNGVEQDLTVSAGVQNALTQINNNVAHSIGRRFRFEDRYLDGYLADVHFIDGQALTPSSFTEVDATTGQLVPIEYTGTFGTNGFHLPFSDNSTAAALGTDTSGAGNDWTVSNIYAAALSGNWASQLSVNNSGNSISNPSNAFDGSTSTYASLNLEVGGTRGLVWTPATTITVSSSLRVYWRSWTSTTYNNGYVYVNGTNQGQVPGNINGWYTVNFTGTITTLELRSVYNSGGGHHIDLAAIEVDGQIIRDVLPSEIDSLVDTPTNYGTDTGAGGEVRGNYCTWNPLIYRQGFANAAVYTNGNLDALFPNTTFGQRGFGSIFVTSGKWYVEVLVNTSNSSTQIGVANIDYSNNVTSVFRSYKSDGQFFNGTSSVSYGSSYTSGDLIGIAFDMDTGSLTFYKNGVSQGVASTDLVSLESISVAALGNSSVSLSLNAGQRPFASTAPSGFKALCTQNLDDPLVAKPSTVMDVKLYTGNGGTQTISGLGFSPDLVWIKSRVGTVNHVLTDTVRGAALKLASNTTGAEAGTDNGYLSAFTSDGFTVAQGGGAYPGIETNYNPGTPYVYAAWAWDAGSSTATNTDGSITSSVRANASAGFSIVTYTGNATAGATVGHGLNDAPAMYIVKRRNASSAWYVYHKDVTTGKVLILNATDAENASSFTNSTEPTSSVFTLGSATAFNASGSPFIAYCFAPVDGYSSFGSYTGNGSADGPFVFCNFRPRWIMVKRTNATENWQLWDTSRDSYNSADRTLFANLSTQESNPDVYYDIDILSNGFKLRNSHTGSNASSSTYIYCAFAESPFKTARAR